MKKTKNNFEEFLASELGHAPLSKELLNRVQTDLGQVSNRVFKKLFGLQMIGAVISLVFCPQFGVGPLGGGHGLMHYFMEYGDLVCALGCGSFFALVSSIVMAIGLRDFELRVVFKKGFKWISAISFVSFTGLMLIGHLLNGDGSQSLAFVAVWLLAVLVLDWMSVQALTRIRAPKAIKTAF